MTKGKRGAPAPRPRASGYVREDQRHTERVTVRLSPETMEQLRDLAAEHGWTVAETVTKAIAALAAEVEND